MDYPPGTNLWAQLQNATVATSFRLSLDPIDPSPFGSLMKFTQRSFSLYVLELSTALYRLGLSTAFTD